MQNENECFFLSFYVKNFKTDVDFKFGTPLNTDILRIALNLKESSVAA